MNWTLPGRLHVIIKLDRVYLVLRIFGRRFEYIRPALPNWHFEMPGEDQ